LVKLLVDTTSRQLRIESDHGMARELPLYSPEAFSVLSTQWLRVGWALKYSYSFSWMGRPIIQLPEDLIRVQEVVYRVKPDVLVETGVAHGGSLIFQAALFRAMGRGRVIGVDVRIRPEVRDALSRHELGPLVALVEGDSASPAVVDDVRSRLAPGESVLVILDSDHSRRHVTAELEAYAPLVTPGSYVVATDGVMQDLHDVPSGRPDWRHDNPCVAVKEFVARHPEFALEEPPFAFNEGMVTERVTYWPGAFLRRVS
jgi:cephalosporin hydroxylase